MVLISVCIGSACHVKGSYNVISSLQSLIEEHDVSKEVEVKAVFCLGQCAQAVAVSVDDDPKIYSLNAKNTKEFFDTVIMPKICR